MQARSERVLSYTGRLIRRQLHFDHARGSLFVTIGQQCWFVEPVAGASHFRCSRRRYGQANSTPQEAVHHV